MAKVYIQERDYSCGASAVRNILSSLNISVTEKTLREKCNTTTDGTELEGIMNCLWRYGITSKKIYTINKYRFQNEIRKTSQAIILTDSAWHWIALLGKENKRYIIVDSDFRLIKRSIRQSVTLKTLTEMADNYDKFKQKKFFAFIKII
jgi:ABC-type bacteriocin/lantibiotic exporter with double-glycine peptidase domain